MRLDRSSRNAVSRALPLLVLALVGVVLTGWGCGRDERSLAQVRTRIRSDLARRAVPPDAAWRDRRTQSLLRAFYAARRMDPAWTDGHGMNGQARDFAAIVSRAEEEGLDPEFYSARALNARLEHPPADAKELAEADLLYTIAAFHYMSDVFDGRISPRALDATWVTKRRAGDLDAVLQAALAKHRVADAMRRLAPTTDQYVRLRRARAVLARAISSGADSSDSVRVQLRLVELNMERWRWMPRSLGDRYLVVNIPEYRLRVVELGRPILDMKVVVGKEASKTPVFSDELTSVVINPDWSVPAGIVADELAPAMQKDPAHLARQNMRVFVDGSEVDATSIDWGDSEEVARVSVRQDPGEGNALGRIKFMFPNRFDVYLHGTPAGRLFAREERGFSHGCVRVEDPLRLASVLLKGVPGGSAREIEEQIASGKTKTIGLPEPLPVHLVYFTAFVDEQGRLGLRDDIYGIDADLSGELRGLDRAQARQRIRASAR